MQTIEVNLDDGWYSLYFDILENDEVYYKFTLVKADNKIKAQYLIDDEFGGVAGQELYFGTL